MIRLEEKKKKYNTQNLIPLDQRSKSEVRELGKKGGIASGKSRALRKTLRESLEIKLDEPSKTKGKTTQDKLIDAIIRKASCGDTKAFEIIRDTIGQKPTDKVEISTYEDALKKIKDVEGDKF